MCPFSDLWSSDATDERHGVAGRVILMTTDVFTKLDACVLVSPIQVE